MCVVFIEAVRILPFAPPWKSRMPDLSYRYQVGDAPHAGHHPIRAARGQETGPVYGYLLGCRACGMPPGPPQRDSERETTQPRLPRRVNAVKAKKAAQRRLGLL